MSLLKVNNPRSLLIKGESGDSLKKVITIRNNKNESKKVIIVPPTPPDQKLVKIVSKTNEEERSNVELDPGVSSLSCPVSSMN